MANKLVLLVAIVHFSTVIWEH